MKKASSLILLIKLCLISAIIITPGFFNCSQKDDPEDPSYIQEVNQWHQRRIASLTRPDGWLSLTGLFWLKQGNNRFGGSPDNDIQFPGKNLPKRMGMFQLEDSLVYLKIADGVAVTHQDQVVSNLKLDSHIRGESTTLHYGSLQWYIIKRGDRFAVRLKDSLSTNRQNFRGIERYPVNSEWRISARFEPYESPRTIEIPNELGTVNSEPSPGKLLFTVHGKQYTLDPIAESEDKRWFLIFGDETNGEETYGAGRYIYIDAPDSTGKAIIDFNKSYNPPCAFSPYATCPLPPSQNFLELRITAGEKKYEGDLNK
jgi:uncharacterized protein (DUF1684 family)